MKKGQYKSSSGETNNRCFEYGVAIKTKGFGYVTLEVPALTIKKGTQLSDSDNIEEIAIELIKQHFEEDVFSLCDENYEPPSPKWVIDFPEYVEHAWKFVTVHTPVPLKIEDMWEDETK
ncbi:hypothetical protein [Vibrio parahaemolyticus]|uniref:hypothetical protein n=1 Tax=Vibrio parahaemolyticus TaxID=670 RepID=UPI00111D9404|nr:hypothetical protein [Vibrio parahaemolyticus]TOF61700.1 hypothetical protein CGJ19_23795 [Vibrio parahaemolyticus]